MLFIISLGRNIRNNNNKKKKKKKKEKLYNFKSLPLSHEIRFEVRQI